MSRWNDVSNTATLGAPGNNSRAAWMPARLGGLCSGASELHRSILKMTGNSRLRQIIGQVVGLPILVQAFTHYSREQLQQSMQQHRVIVAALKARDAEWAESAMRSHILSGRAATLPQ